MAVTITHRLLGPSDQQASHRLGWEAFGFPTGAADAAASQLSFPPLGSHAHGMFDGDELVARLFAREYLSHFAGEQIPTCGIAGVTVKAEHRGHGLLAGLFVAAFAGAIDRGEMISTLFPTAPRIYRKFGYELVGDYCTVEIPSAAVSLIGKPAEVELRRATADDFEAVQRVYTKWAREQHGPLTRTGASFAISADEFIGSFDGVTLAVDQQDSVVGFVSWDRGEGYDSTATIEVSDLIGLTPGATQALWSVLGSFSSVCGQIRIDTSGDDLSRFALPLAPWRVVTSRPYMLAVLDVAGAFTARSVTPAIAADLEFTVAGHPIEAQNGRYRINAGAGRLDCWRTGDAVKNVGDTADDDGERTVTPQGLAGTYAGTQSAANLRLAGLLAGGDPDEDSVWDALFGGRQFHIRDYF